MTSIYHSKTNERALQILESPKNGAWIVSIEPSETELDKLAKDYNMAMAKHPG